MHDPVAIRIVGFILLVVNHHRSPVGEHGTAEETPPLYFEYMCSGGNARTYEIEGVRTRPCAIRVLIGIALELRIGG